MISFSNSLSLLIGQLCGVGKHIASSCGSTFYHANLPTLGKIWQIDIDTTQGKVLWWDVDDKYNKGRQATISDFSNMYHIVMVFGGGTFELNVDNSFLKTKYNPSYVTYPSDSTINVAGGTTTRIIGEQITTTSVTSYRLKFTSYGTNMCFGLISAANINTVALEGGDFSAHWGVCVEAAFPTGQLMIVCPCASCATGCETCTWTSSTACTSCTTGYYYGTTSCQPCHHLCSACFGYVSNQCTACKPGAFLQDLTACSETCPFNEYWPDSTNNICAPCDSACFRCTGPSNTECSMCKTGYFLQPASTICLNSCPTGYGGNPTTKICVLCDSSCLVCTGSLNSECSACNPGYFYSQHPQQQLALTLVLKLDIGRTL